MKIKYLLFLTMLLPCVTLAGNGSYVFTVTNTAGAGGMYEGPITVTGHSSGLDNPPTIIPEGATVTFKVNGYPVETSEYRQVFINIESTHKITVNADGSTTDCSAQGTMKIQWPVNCDIWSNKCYPAADSSIQLGTIQGFDSSGCVTSSTKTKS